MYDKRSLAKSSEQLALLETITKAYGEIAAQRMQKTRKSVLVVRTFLQEIFDLFYEVRVGYFNELQKNPRNKNKDITFLSHNGKQVALLLSANTGLFGDIIKKTFDLFLAEAKSGKSEVTIVGKQGLNFFTSQFPNQPYTYFDLPDFNIKASHLAPIIRHIVKYDEIHLYYGRFQNVVVQEPIMVTISSKIDLNDKKEKAVVHDYIFEPSIEDILAFFEGEIFSSVFQQSINESQLAKLASRISAMNRASEKIAEERGKLDISKLSLVHKIADQKQRNSIPAILSLVG